MADLRIACKTTRLAVAEPYEYITPQRINMMFSPFDEACAYAVLLSHVCRNVYKHGYTPGDVLCKLLSGAAVCLACEPTSVKDLFDGRGQVTKVDSVGLAKPLKPLKQLKITPPLPVCVHLTHLWLTEPTWLSLLFHASASTRITASSSTRLT